MANEFRFPDIGEGLTEAEIVRWLVAEGEYVEADQPVVEVETDKAVVEIPSPYAGTVLRHGAAEGETIEVGSVLVVVGDEEENAASDEIAVDAPLSAESAPLSAEFTSPSTELDSPDEETVSVATAAPIVGSLDENAEDLSPSAPGEDEPVPSQIKALPLVRKLAREMSIDLATVPGSGPAGRITREDLLAVAEPAPVSQPSEATVSAPTEERVAAAEEGATPGPSAGTDERRRLSRLRRTIAANLSKSWAEVPHVTTFDDVDATRLLEVRQALGSRYETKIPLEALVVKAIVPALRSFPEFNATLDGDDLVIHGAHDIGIAVDTPDGLLVAVIRDAASKGVLELSSEVRRLGEGARNRTLGVDELSGQTFTVSNIGAVGGGHGTPIVPPGTTAILSVGRAQQKPIVADGELVIAPVMPLSLSYDHRVIDGGLGRRFMAEVMENLEEPALFLAG